MSSKNCQLEAFGPAIICSLCQFGYLCLFDFIKILHVLHKCYVTCIILKFLSFICSFESNICTNTGSRNTIKVEKSIKWTIRYDIFQMLPWRKIYWSHDQLWNLIIRTWTWCTNSNPNTIICICTWYFTKRLKWWNYNNSPLKNIFIITKFVEPASKICTTVKKFNERKIFLWLFMLLVFKMTKPQSIKKIWVNWFDQLDY